MEDDWGRESEEFLVNKTYAGLSDPYLKDPSLGKLMEVSIKQLMQPLQPRICESRISDIGVEDNAQDESMDDKRIFEYGPRGLST